MSVLHGARRILIPVLLLLGWALARADSLPNPFPAGSVVTQTLPNGLRLVVREDHSLPIVSAVLVVRGGSGTNDPRGAAHYAEHLVLQGTKRYPGRLAPQHALERVGGITDAVTSRDMTRFQATAASSQARLLVEVLADVALAPTLDDESFARERPTVLQEIQDMGDDIQATLINLGYLSSFRTHPYHDRTTGSIQDVLRLGIDDVRDYVRRWYVPNNMSVVLVGDVTVKQAAALVESAFGAAKSATLPAWPAAEAPGDGAPTQIFIPTAHDDAYQVLVFPAPSLGDFPAMMATDVLTALLASHGDGLLPARWTQDGIPVRQYGVEYVSARGPGRLIVWARTEPTVAEALRTSTLRLFVELAERPVPAETLARARQHLATQVLMENEAYSQQAATLAFYEGLGGAAAVATRYAPAIAKVTPAQLQAAIPTRLLAHIVLGPPEEEN